MIYLYFMATIKRLLSQHGCTVMIIPKPVCRTLDLHPGDYIEIEAGNLPHAGWFRKLDLQENPDGKSPGPRAQPDR
jgi:antitoxin component of MazEF toxin-antitoxin module